MPAKNVIKNYVENGYYHIYNRGVEKREIFLDEQDHQVFLHFLKRYLTSPPKDPLLAKARYRSDLFDKAQLLCYCLMPNHFHLLLKQNTLNAMSELVRALSNSYVRYFNDKHERIGALFQGTYKAVLIKTDEQLLHLTRYIHLNPLEILLPGEAELTRGVGNLRKYQWSSFGEYLGLRKTAWIHPEEVLAFFKTAQKTNLKDTLSYQSFVEDYVIDSQELLGPLIIE